MCSTSPSSFIRVLGAVALYAVLLLSLTGCGKKGHAPDLTGYVDLPVASVAEAPADTTPVEFYYYINSDQDILGTAPDGSIENQGEILAAQLETLAVNARTTNFGIHVYLDRGLALHDGDRVDSEQFDVCDGKAVHESLPETDSRDPANLTAILKKSCFKNAKRFVVIWSHGNGFRTQKDYDYDPTAGLFHISTLLNAIPPGFAEAVLFDSCAMASLEIASLLPARAKYLLSSQFELPNEGLQYGNLPATLEKTRDTVEILKSIRAESEKLFKEMEIRAPLIILGLAKVEALTAAFRGAWKSTLKLRTKDYGLFRGSILRGDKDGDLIYLFGKVKAGTPADRKLADGFNLTLKAALVDGRGSLSFAIAETSRGQDTDLESVAVHYPKLFRTWSEKFPNWAAYAQTRIPANVPQPQGAPL